MALKVEELFIRLSELADSRPDLRAIDDNHDIPESTQKWLGRLHAVLQEGGYSREGMELRVQIGALSRSQGRAGRSEILNILHRALASAELRSPAEIQGSFIAAGDEFHAFAKLAKVFARAEGDILIVDPYMDEVTLTDFAPLVGEKVRVRLLAADGRVKQSLEPAASRWIAQYGELRPLEVRLALANHMHDRLILIDQSNAWLVTQSFKDFAKKAHGSIVQTDSDAASMKIAAYEEIWASAKKII